MNPTEKTQIRNFLREVSGEMERAFGESLVSHPGEKGAAREVIFRKFLERHLPARFGITTGFVFDSKGTLSRQIDVIIYDKFLCPTFEASGEKRFIPCESVVSVGEVKSQLTSKKEVIDALGALESAKRLNRSLGGVNADTGLPLDQSENYLDQIFTFVFIVGRTISASGLCAVLYDHLSGVPRHIWPNIIFSYKKYLQTYSCANGWCPNAMHAESLTVLNRESSAEMLLTFYLLLGQAISVTGVARFPYASYIGLESKEHGTFPLPESPD